ncbi:MAG: glutamate-5-semialdehyde dehydrogenase [Desulfovibrio sp.]|jgi:glutamate-5-semialdehyde dehydrogenase|nr:glutamate-5-semialdehyde dehydrogenase [Desulfovibrio sp.]
MDTESSPVRRLGREARAAAPAVGALSGKEKNALLLFLADALESRTDPLLAANAGDVAAAREAGLPEGLLDRLLLNPGRLRDIAADTRAVAALPDPVGEVLDGRSLDSGLFLIRRRVPLGVVAAIYEARPNVTVDITALCLKTGNAVILRGGRETARTNAALLEIIHTALARHSLPAAAVQAISDPDHSLVTELLRLNDYVDMLIPRGGEALQRLCREESRIPVITGGIGVCHIFVAASARQNEALAVIENAKAQKPSACNAVETILVQRPIAREFLPKLHGRLAPLGVTLHAGEAARPLFAAASIRLPPVAEGDYDREWLSLDCNVEVVEDLEAALLHIRTHGTGHSDAILTEDMDQAGEFTRRVDSAAVYVNASTRFTDGGQFGLGAEVAVSTQKLHARGPVSLEGLTTSRWIATGRYSLRA